MYVYINLIAFLFSFSILAQSSKKDDKLNRTFDILQYDYGSRLDGNKGTNLRLLHLDKSYHIGKNNVTFDLSTDFNWSCGQEDQINHTRKAIIGFGKTVERDGLIVGIIGTIGYREPTHPENTVPTDLAVFGPKIFIAFNDGSYASFAHTFALNRNYTFIDINVGKIPLSKLWTNEIEAGVELNSESAQYKANTSFFYKDLIGVTAGCSNMGDIGDTKRKFRGFLGGTLRLKLN